ncbi:hypothetical protein BKA83DRAFT_4129792 [Pisolithus microcarpus]|nr:hypothetical protein BKA83DRAFT_4129792 [Pisolithus microcarpus]
MTKQNTWKGITMIGPTPGHWVKLEVKKQKVNGRCRSRLVEVIRKESHTASTDGKSQSSSPSKDCRSPSKHHLSQFQDGLQQGYDMLNYPDEPLQMPHKKTQNDYIWEWVPQQEEFPWIILEMEAPPEP